MWNVCCIASADSILGKSQGSTIYSRLGSYAFLIFERQCASTTLRANPRRCALGPLTRQTFLILTESVAFIAALNREANLCTGYSPLLNFDVMDLDTLLPSLLQMGATLDGPIKYPQFGKVTLIAWLTSGRRCFSHLSWTTLYSWSVHICQYSSTTNVKLLIHGSAYASPPVQPSVSLFLVQGYIDLDTHHMEEQWIRRWVSR